LKLKHNLNSQLEHASKTNVSDEQADDYTYTYEWNDSDEQFTGEDYTYTYEWNSTLVKIIHICMIGRTTKHE